MPHSEPRPDGLPASSPLPSRLARLTGLPADFFLYGSVGALGAALHFALLALLLNALGLPFLPSHAAVTFAVMVVNFVLNNRFTFPAHRLHGPAFLRGLVRFCLVSSVGALVNVATAYLAIRLVPFWPAATVAGIAAGTVWNYRMSKRLTWNAR